MSQVREHRQGHWVESTLLPVLLGPLLVRVDRVDGACEHGAVHFIERCLSIGELDDLGRAHESEVEWVPHQYEVLALEIAERLILETAIWVVNLSREVWGWVLNSANWFGVHFLLLINLWLIKLQLSDVCSAKKSSMI